MAGVLDLGSTALVSHRAAAALHGFDGFRASPVELTSDRSRRGAAGPWTVHTTRRLELIDRVRVDGFPATSASRTIIDLAGTASVAELERAIDSAVRDGLSSPLFLARRLERLRAAAGAAWSSSTELLVDCGGHSELERRFLALVRLGRACPARPASASSVVTAPRGPRRLQLRAASGHRRGLRPSRPQLRCRAGP